jgi:site-specific recombinase XerC
LIATKAPSTASAAITALRGVLRVCWLQQRIDGESYHRLVASCIRVRGERLPRGRALDVDEVSRMHRVASTRDRAMLALLFGAGMRRSEAAAVTWDMIQGDELRVIGKGNKQRAVPLPRWALEALEAHRIEVSTAETSARLVRGFVSNLETCLAASLQMGFTMRLVLSRRVRRSCAAARMMGAERISANCSTSRTCARPRRSVDTRT